ncbi:hypothetical protein PN462_05235 [Spirulina sp. CS-785/01]|uniref:hypothetical protein n=1 Tax=Spirulina sp. CS-785/01 TaxID=3021716 RepID=UPI00232AA63F|nr:hypothetical protein [Spirulina sp. CS-785/01]MDB9312500.1 hypothetical protein [Spirulina sp. CS-785/01]
MSYTFDIVGLASVVTFFDYQQKVESNPHRSKAYFGTQFCTLDAFIESANLIPQKPDWNWEEVVQSMIHFWLRQEDKIRYWQEELNQANDDNLLVGRVANVPALRHELESLLNSE